MLIFRSPGEAGGYVDGYRATSREIAKQADPRFDDLNRRLDNIEPAFERAFRESVDEWTEGVDDDEVSRLLAAGGAAALLGVLRPSDFERILADNLQDAIDEAIGSGAAQAVSRAGVSGFALDGRGIAEAFARDHVADAVREIADNTRRGIRSVVVRGIADGERPGQLASRIRNVSGFGLTAQQTQAVDNLRRGLERAAIGEITAESLENRFKLLRDVSIRRRLNAGRTEAIVRDYRDRFLQFRAETIARRESAVFLAAGRQAAWVEMGRLGLVDQEVQVVEWMVTPDERACILGSETQVMTDEGWRAIKNIKTGDRVMTHRDRFREVIATDVRGEYEGEVVKFDLPGGGFRRLTVTPDHPMYVHRGGENAWIEAGDVTESDKLIAHAVPCTDCGKVLPSGPYRRHYDSDRCCPSCSALRSNESRWSKDGEREKLRKRNRRKWREDEEYRRMMTEAMKSEDHPAHSDEARERARQSLLRKFRLDDEFYHKVAERNRQYAKDPEHPFNKMTDEKRAETLRMALKARGAKSAASGINGTYIERKVAWFLTESDLAFEDQWQYEWVNSDGETKTGYADFFVPGANTVIECDGYLHDDPEVAEVDRQKTAGLEGQGFTVLRFSGEEIRERFWEVASAIRELCCLTPIPIKEIHRKSIRKGILYDLQVEEDESFIAAGVVVHNCPICVPMHGQRRPIGESFTTGDGREVQFPGETHPQCRCDQVVVDVRRQGVSEARGRTDDRIGDLADDLGVTSVA